MNDWTCKRGGSESGDAGDAPAREDAVWDGTSQPSPQPDSSINNPNRTIDQLNIYMNKSTRYDKVLVLEE